MIPLFHQEQPGTGLVLVLEPMLGWIKLSHLLRTCLLFAGKQPSSSHDIASLWNASMSIKHVPYGSPQNNVGPHQRVTSTQFHVASMKILPVVVAYAPDCSANHQASRSLWAVVLDGLSSKHPRVLLEDFHAHLGNDRKILGLCASRANLDRKGGQEMERASRSN